MADTRAVIGTSMLELADEWDARAAELDGTADRASLRGADPMRITLLTTRAQTLSECANQIRVAVTANQPSST